MTEPMMRGRKIGIAIGLAFITGFVYLGYILYIQGEYNMLVPIVFGIAFMSIMIVAMMLRPKTIAVQEKQVPYSVGLPRAEISDIEGDDNFHLLLASKDCVFISTLVSEFKKDDIDYSVLDQYAGRMMKFLPDSEMKVMVKGSDYKRCIAIAENLTEGITNED